MNTDCVINLMVRSTCLLEYDAREWLWGIACVIGGTLFDILGEDEGCWNMICASLLERRSKTVYQAKRFSHNRNRARSDQIYLETKMEPIHDKSLERLQTRDIFQRGL
jgi:hypothetical protein